MISGRNLIRMRIKVPVPSDLTETIKPPVRQRMPSRRFSLNDSNRDIEEATAVQDVSGRDGAHLRLHPLL